MLKIGGNSQKAIILFGASIIGMLLGVANSAINTNYLPPTAYGNVRYVQNIITFFSSILLLGFFVSGSRLLAITKEEQRKKEIRGAMIMILTLTLIALMLILGIFGCISWYINDYNMASLYFISIPVCGNILFLNYINTTAQGDGHINRISLARIFPPFIYLLISITIYKNLGATQSLMLILYNGSAVIVLSIIILSTKPTFIKLKNALNLLMIENKKYGFHVYLGSIAGVSTSYIAGITLGQFCDDNINVGYYTLALSLATPLTLLPSIIGMTYYKKFASQKKIERKIITYSLFLTIISVIIFIFGIKYLVEFLYPESYSSVSKYAAWLSISSACYGYGDMYNRFLGSHGQGKQIRNSSYACGIVIFIGSILLVYLFEIVGAIITRIVGAGVYMGLMIHYYRKFVAHEVFEC